MTIPIETRLYCSRPIEAACAKMAPVHFVLGIEMYDGEDAMGGSM